MTTLMALDLHHRTVQIGSTWYAASVQGSAVNPETKYLLLRYCFRDAGPRL